MTRLQIVITTALCFAAAGAGFLLCLSLLDRNPAPIIVQVTKPMIVDPMAGIDPYVWIGQSYEDCRDKGVNKGINVYDFDREDRKPDTIAQVAIERGVCVSFIIKARPANKEQATKIGKPPDGHILITESVENF